jgi:N-glycosylase/DNA lyase
MPPLCTTTLEVRDYDLAATLSSGQAFRWTEKDGWWEGVIAGRWVRLRQSRAGLHPAHPQDAQDVSVRLPDRLETCPTLADGFSRIEVEAASFQPDWHWLTDYLQSDIDLSAVLATFPDDASMRGAVGACRGLRLLRQEPWESLASFICSSTKQIEQIRQIVALLCERFGEAIPTPDGGAHSFPSAGRIASLAESGLRACKLGFRAPYVHAAARAVAEGRLNLEALRTMSLAEAREALMTLPGVGRKIADCVLLFGYGFPQAFPVDVWVLRALRELYFPKRRPKSMRLLRFTETYFGPNAGYAQQYLFHYMRTRR